MGLALAIVILGPAPAALISGSSILVGWVCSRPRYPLSSLRNNLGVFQWFPFSPGSRSMPPCRRCAYRPNAPGFYALVAGTFLIS